MVDSKFTFKFTSFLENYSNWIELAYPNFRTFLNIFNVSIMKTKGEIDEIFIHLFFYVILVLPLELYENSTGAKFASVPCYLSDNMFSDLYQFRTVMCK